ncbi:MAG: four helix bundle protein [Cyanobacteria bacterium P01_F01_bin.86]
MVSRGLIRRHHDLEVYQLAFDAATEIVERSKQFPFRERYALTEQIQRSSRSVCANLAEAWCHRQYTEDFVAKLNDSEAEAAETQAWIHSAVLYGYLTPQVGTHLNALYDQILGKLVALIKDPTPDCFT